MPAVSLIGGQRSFQVAKIICVGRNYAGHAKEMKADLPTTPVLFLKPPSAIIHDGGHIVIPPISQEMHHEVEMTVLLGKGGKHIPREKALTHIAGFGVGLDMTLRDVQSEAKKKGLPWTLAKGFDTSAPLSGFAPAASVRDPHNLNIELSVNGGARQKGNTGEFIFRLDQLISYISTFFTLEEGDIIFTGTPEGVAQVLPGDVLEARLSDLGGSTLASLTVDLRES